MSRRRDGWIGHIASRPVLWLAIAGTALVVASLANLLMFRFAPFSDLLRPQTVGRYTDWFLGPIPWGFFLVAALLGTLAGTAMLIIAAAWRGGRPTKMRLIGCTLIGAGAMTVAVAFANGASGWWLGIVLIAIGVAILLQGRSVGMSS